MSEDTSEIIYQTYRSAKKLIERAEACSGNHSDEPVFEEWKKAIKIFDDLDRGYAERYEKEEKMKAEKEQAAFNELKSEMVKLMFDFTNKYASKGDNCLYPQAGYILVDVLMDCLSEAQYQIVDTPKFTSKQINHICYQIGDWYLMMKPLLEGQHNLGYMKEKLKTMICGE